MPRGLPLRRLYVANRVFGSCRFPLLSVLTHPIAQPSTTQAGAIMMLAGGKPRGIIDKRNRRQNHRMTTAKDPTARLPRIDFHQAQFLQSASNLSNAPPDGGSEVAFAGRSNAGKSSAINTLTGNRKLARTSRTPGRTQLINFFSLSDDQRLVDLPGYGYAKVPLKMKQAWNRHMEQYLQRRQSLRGLILLMDVRHPLTDADEQMLNWAAAAEMPVRVLLTKADKLKRGPAKSTLLAVQARLLEFGDLASAQLFSSLKGDGLPALRKKLQNWLTDDSVLTEADT